MIRRDALQVSFLPATLLPMIPKRFVLPRDGPRAETVRGQQEYVMVAEQYLDASSSGGSLLLQSHDQLDGADAFRSMIDQIAHEPEGALPTTPGLVAVFVFADQLRAA